MTDHPSLPSHHTGSYHLIRSGRLHLQRGHHTHITQHAHAALQKKLLAPDFSCVAARAAINTSSYALGCYGPLGSDHATAGLAHDLAQFCGHQDAMTSGFTTMIAVFDGPEPTDEHAFEAALWAQLRALHAADPRPYSPEVTADPADVNFGFSFNGRGFFVIGLHPHASRHARTFPHPTLVFNAHRQFRRLRETGRFDLLQRSIRQRELRVQGSLNPNLANYGEAPEARQYSGRAVEPDWVAPFPTVEATNSAAPGRCPFGQGRDSDQ